MGKTSIEWTDASWNPIVGCTEISPGCANCYAARLAETRLKNHPDYKGLAIQRSERLDDADANAKYFKIRPHWTGEVRFVPERLEEPLHWKRPRRIFVCDMGDLFHESVDPVDIARIFLVMQRAHWNTFQVLTKRADRMHRFMHATHVGEPIGPAQEIKFPLPNVWLGVSVENQHFAKQRIPLLLTTPAAVRWISAEPLLGLVNFQAPQTLDMPGINWVVCGGESGPNARPMHPEWARSLRDQCQAAGVPFFFKQWGEWGPASVGARREMHVFPGGALAAKWGKKDSGRLLDGREWNEFPHRMDA